MTSRCPYDPQHILPTDSLLNHLRKCKSTNKHLFTHCKYEPLHVVLKAELDSHYKRCQMNTQSRKGEEEWDNIGKNNYSKINEWDQEEDDEISQKQRQQTANRKDKRGEGKDKDKENIAKKQDEENSFPQNEQKVSAMMKYKKPWLQNEEYNAKIDSQKTKSDEKKAQEQSLITYKLEKKTKIKKQENESFRSEKNSTIDDWD